METIILTLLANTSIHSTSMNIKIHDIMYKYLNKYIFEILIICTNKASLVKKQKKFNIHFLDGNFYFSIFILFININYNLILLQF